MNARLPLLAMLVGNAVAAVPVTAGAHSELERSDPADGANVQTAPTAVVLTFTEELDPAGSSFTVTDASGVQVGAGEVDLSVAARNILRGGVSITKPGSHRIAWTSLSLDGDQLQGTLTFGYRLPSPPNTATLRRHGSDSLPLSAVGLLLLAAAGLIIARRPALR